MQTTPGCPRSLLVQAGGPHSLTGALTGQTGGRPAHAPAGIQSGEASSSPEPARRLWGTAVAELGLELAPGLWTVLLAEPGAAGKAAVTAEGPGSLALARRAAAGCKECGTVSQLAPGFLLERELQTAQRFLGQRHQLGRCNLSPEKMPQEGG